ncbi:nitroreductase family protein [Parasegetibacter sp. NRK P23]|uniref:nitroreductase family protein n=1 Tax=Parasegetibacter sp. NRK P23 TaxID=2942999 RepID=UPI0020442C10|nr:nitroreductase family protein [Parasegetibacter sp. NRK P23]MCM5526818.1 nitroreductase family protein [Parasegetibacter sp. NRK P23]
MSILNALQWRYATKRMNGQAVPEEKVNAILEATRLSPSSLGLQPYTILVITDPELKKKIQPIAYNQPQIVESSHLLVFAAWEKIADFQVDAYIGQIAEERGLTLEALDGFKSMITGATSGKDPEQSFQWNARQAYIAFGTAIVAAAEQGVDATPMEGFNGPELDVLLGLKEKGLRAVTLLPLGYRDAAQDALASAPKVRRKREELFVEL